MKYQVYTEGKCEIMFVQQFEGSRVCHEQRVEITSAFWVRIVKAYQKVGLIYTHFN